MSFLISIVLLTVITNCAKANDIRPIATTLADRAIPAGTDAGEIQLAAREVQVEIIRPNAKNSKGALLVVFDAASGIFARRFAWVPGYPGNIPMVEGFLLESKAYLTRDRLVFFTVAGGAMYVWEFSAKAKSLDDAEAQALAESEGDLADYVGKMTGGFRFSFDKQLGREFSTGLTDAVRGPIKFLGVSHSDGKWHITVVGRWKAKVTLTTKYEVESTERLR